MNSSQITNLLGKDDNLPELKHSPNNTLIPLLEINFTVIKNVYLPLLSNTKIADEAKEFITTVEENVTKINQILASTEISTSKSIVLGYIEDIERKISTFKATKDLSSAQKSTVNTIRTSISEQLSRLGNALKDNQLQGVEEAYKTAALFCGQDTLYQNLEMKNHFEELLKNINQTLKQNLSFTPPTVFISYAWPTVELKDKEYWIQPFLKRFATHLKLAGLNVRLDIGGIELNGNPVGGNIFSYMEYAEKSDYVLLICTESLKYKHTHGHGLKAVNTELNHIMAKRLKDQININEQRVFPLLISGSHETSYPEAYKLYNNVLDMREESYVNNIKQILTAILPIDKISNVWDNFLNQYIIFQNIMDEKYVQKFLQLKRYQDLQEKIQSDEQYNSLLNAINFSNVNNILSLVSHSTANLLTDPEQNGDVLIEKLRDKILHDKGY